MKNQKKLPHHSSLKKVIEERMEGKKAPGTPSEMLLHWLVKEENIDYAQIKRR